MSRSSFSRFFLKNLYQNHHQISRKPTSPFTGISHFLFSKLKTSQKPTLSPWLKDLQTTHFSAVSKNSLNPAQKIPFLFKKGDLATRVSANFVANVEKKHFHAVKEGTFSRIFQNPAQKFNLKPNGVSKRDYFKKSADFGLSTKPFSMSKETVGLLIETGVFGFLAVTITVVTAGVLLEIADIFVGSSENMVLPSIIVGYGLSTLFVAWRCIIKPDQVYRMAMTMLNTSTGIHKIMGAPLECYFPGGEAVRKNLVRRAIGNRCSYIFPIRGSERTGSVTVEVKNKYCGYDMKLLAVDIDMDSGPAERLFLIGDEEVYDILIARIGQRKPRIGQQKPQEIVIKSDYAPLYVC